MCNEVRRAFLQRVVCLKQLHYLSSVNYNAPFAFVCNIDFFHNLLEEGKNQKN